jgi:hypothetical protein
MTCTGVSCKLHPNEFQGFMYDALKLSEGHWEPTVHASTDLILRLGSLLQADWQQSDGFVLRSIQQCRL